ncbi:TonB family protein [Sphingomonas sp. JC676]|uniref:energy transducer TonB n=1 Tax=Sphingomonas sp. JC676 TaxID=2768065 RepID=UPI001657FBAD|nr:energy transducer TonB [Sphingomonas sp. JC676]MBC9034539.1 TonB family protein [Sphingomonas sp. JC676]
MYANHRYQPPHSRGFSFGAALAINAAIIAGLIYSAPNIIGKEPIRFIINDYKDPPVPPPVEQPKPQPKTVKRDVAREPLPTAPKPEVLTKSDNTSATTDVIDPPQPFQPKVIETGPPTTVEPPKVLPPLMGAEQDPRYLKDFQPEYPSSELRAQRDGQVRVRVRIGVDGRVKEVQQLGTTSTAFFEVTKRQALGKWRFKPASRGGVPEESWKVMNVRFELENAR